GRMGRTLVRSLSNSPTREEASGERPVPRRHQPGADQAPRAADHPSRPASPPRLVLAGAHRLGHLRRVRPGRDLHGLPGQGLDPDRPGPAPRRPVRLLVVLAVDVGGTVNVNGNLENRRTFWCIRHSCTAIPRLGNYPDRCWKAEFTRHLSTDACLIVKAAVVFPVPEESGAAATGPAEHPTPDH